MIRWAMAFGLVVAVVLAADPAGALTVAQDLAQDDVSDRCRTIIGCPDAGPKPEHPGDRGGSAQFATLAFLAAGAGFIMFKVFRATRASDPTPADSGSTE